MKLYNCTQAQSEVGMVIGILVGIVVGAYILSAVGPTAIGSMYNATGEQAGQPLNSSVLSPSIINSWDAIPIMYIIVMLLIPVAIVARIFL